MNNTKIVGNKIYVNDVYIDNVPGNGKSSNITVINDKVYANGYEYRNGVWKRTLAALFHRFF